MPYKARKIRREDQRWGHQKLSEADIRERAAWANSGAMTPTEANELEAGDILLHDPSPYGYGRRGMSAVEVTDFTSTQLVLGSRNGQKVRANKDGGTVHGTGGTVYMFQNEGQIDRMVEGRLEHLEKEEKERRETWERRRTRITGRLASAMKRVTAERRKRGTSKDRLAHLDTLERLLRGALQKQEEADSSLEYELQSLAEGSAEMMLTKIRTREESTRLSLTGLDRLPGMLAERDAAFERSRAVLRETNRSGVSVKHDDETEASESWKECKRHLLREY